MARFRSSSDCWFISLNCMYCDSKPLCRKKSDRARIRSSALMPKSSPLYREYRTFTVPPLSRLVKLPSRPLPRLAAFGLISPALLGREASLFAAADPAMRVQAFQNELRRRGADGVRFVHANAQRGGLLHQPLNPPELLHHGSRIDVFVQLQ